MDEEHNLLTVRGKRDLVSRLKPIEAPATGSDELGQDGGQPRRPHHGEHVKPAQCIQDTGQFLPASDESHQVCDLLVCQRLAEAGHSGSGQALGDETG